MRGRDGEAVGERHFATLTPHAGRKFRVVGRHRLDDQAVAEQQTPRQCPVLTVREQLLRRLAPIDRAAGSPQPATPARRPQRRPRSSGNTAKLTRRRGSRRVFSSCLFATFGKQLGDDVQVREAIPEQRPRLFSRQQHYARRSVEQQQMRAWTQLQALGEFRWNHQTAPVTHHNWVRPTHGCKYHPVRMWARRRAQGPCQATGRRESPGRSVRRP